MNHFKQGFRSFVAAVFVLTNSGALVAAPVYAKAGGNGQVTLCHRPPGNPSAQQTLRVGAGAVRAHLGHGDRLGACERDDEDGDRDQQAPMITNVQAGAVTASSAKISWHTNEPATSKVVFADEHLANAVSADIVSDGNLVTEHSLMLMGLSATTKYFFKVVSKDAAGNRAMSAEMMFTTQGATDVTAPVITGVAATAITGTSAKIVWMTNESSNSKVEFAAGPLGSTAITTAMDGAMVTSHMVMLSGLSVSTTYHFRVKSADAAGNVGMSAEMMFTTQASADVTAPVISGVQAIDITPNSSAIHWMTNEAASSKVEYATAPLATAAVIHVASDSALMTTHHLPLSGLAAATTYYFRVSSRDASGNAATSGEMTFTTTATDATAPVITNVQATSTNSTSSKIMWTTNEPANSKVEYATSPLGSAGTILNVSDSTRVTSHMLMLSGLTASTTYYFRVKSVDAAGNAAMSVEQSFTTAAGADTSGPVISGVGATSTMANSARVVWSTNEPSTSRVTFAKQSLATATTMWSVFSSMLTGAHDLMLSGLSAATTYFFKVESMDAAGNTTTSAEQTFTTQP